MRKQIWKRLGYVCVFFLFIVSVFYYQEEKDDFGVTMNAFLESPAGHSGIVGSFMGTYTGEWEQGFIVRYNGRNVYVIYGPDYEAPRLGEVLVYGKTLKSGYIEALGVHNYDYNYVIYFLSFIAGLFVIWQFFSEWKITIRGFKDA